MSRTRTLLPDVVAIGGTTDPYQPAEVKYDNIRQCLAVLERHQYPVHVCTKSTLVLRDLQLLESIGKYNWCTVSVTITTADPAKAGFLEPRAPAPEARFGIIRQIKDAAVHVQAGVLLMPVVPLLCDSPEDLEAIE